MTPVDKRTREERVLVRSFGELRCGMLVVVLRCRVCGDDHRQMLMKQTFVGDWSTTTTLAECRSFIGPCTVEQRRVYRIVDGLEKTDEQANDRRVPVSSGVEG